MRANLVVMAAIAWAGCNGAGAGGAGGPMAVDGGLAPEDLVKATQEAFCQWGVRCGMLAASEKEACLATPITSTWDVAAAVKAGRVAWDRERAAACVAWLRDHSGCGFLPAVAGPDCAAAYHGLVAIGGTCQSDPECSDGWCDQGAQASPGCPGTCRARLASASTCARSAQCAATDYCDPLTLRCATAAAPGGSCTGGASCGPQRVCAGVGFGNGTGVCVDPATGGEGAACTPLFGQECRPDFYCSPGGAVCRPRVALGGACETRFGCQDGLVCTAPQGGSSARCVAVVDVGGACDPTQEGESACAGDLLCDPASSLCVARKKFPSNVGHVCVGTVDCNDPTLYCHAGACAPRLSLGAACSATEDQPCLEATCDGATGRCALSCG